MFVFVFSPFFGRGRGEIASLFIFFDFVLLAFLFIFFFLVLVLSHRRILRPSPSSCFADQRFSQPHHCFPQRLALAFLTSSLRPATAREQWNVGARFRQPQHCSEFFRECPRISSPLSPIHLLGRRHTRTSPSDITHQHVLQLSLLRRSRRAMSPTNLSCRHPHHTSS